LFAFLAIRASDGVISAILDADPNLLHREARRYWRVSTDQRLRFLARVHGLHRLPDGLREEAASELDRAATEDLDVSFLDDEELLSMFQPRKLLGLGIRLLGMLAEVIPNRIAEIAAEADPDQDIPDQFDQVKSFVDQLQEHLADAAATVSTLQSLNDDIEDAIADVSKRKTPEDDYGTWPDVSPAKVAASRKGRSMFSDVDE
jgi:hypothetical protein